MSEPTPRKQLDAFVAKFDPALAANVRKILAVMRKRLPGTLELVYDNYNALAVAFGRSDRVKDVLFSIAVYPRWASLFFFDARGLKDPKRLLKGSGAKMRHIVLTDSKTLADPDVKALMDQVLKAQPLDPAQEHRIIIKSVSARQRPRRPGRS